MQDMVYRFRPALIILARIISGLLLAGASSMVFIAVAWGLFVFSSSQSAQTWLILQLAAAGTGAGVGSMVAWFNIDRNTGLMLTLMAAVAILGGLAGSWLGHGYGSPITYLAIGAALMANLAMLVFRLAKNIFRTINDISHRRVSMAKLTDASEYRSVNQ